MKLKKIKNLIFTFIICLFGAFAFNSIKAGATAFPNNNNGQSTIITYDEGTPYSYTLNSKTYTYFINYDSTEQSYIVNYYYYNDMQSRWEYRNYYYCNLTINNSYLQLSCSRYQYLYGTGYTNPSSVSQTNDFFIYPTYFRDYWNSWQYKPATTGGYTSEDLEDSFNAGYEDGVALGSNNGLLIDSCTFDNLVNGSCNSQYYSLTSGSINFDSLNEFVYDLGGNDYSITFTFINSIDSDSLLYVRFKETIGSSISFYNGDTLLETLYNDDFDSNQSDYYKTFRLSDFGQISSPFNKIVVNNSNYDYAISEFGVLQYQSYDLGFENGEIHGEIVGFANGNIAGYNRGFIAGEQNGNNLVNLVGAIFTGPVTMFQQIFNFNVLGINFAGMLLGLVTLLVVIWLIKKFI